MDIVVKGRNVEVPDHYRQLVAEKLGKVERYDHKVIRVDVELFHERNPRQSDHCQRVEITCVTRGPLVRAEACAADFYSALDAAISKLDTRMRRAADRRRVHRGRHTPISVAEATAPLAYIADTPMFADTAGSARSRTTGASALLAERDAPAAALDAEPDDQLDDQPDDQPWHIVREKEHPGEPMTVDDALFHMELLGHDFYLFNDKDSGRPSVVYRRRGYDYGVISLGL
ncbi:MAG TPA: ribosome-associated translation inhibitor RaiA [Micromonosporaceae bacterium]|nr:ribosome-associated translation inhibitor RaiA [Micromonosporaceae bacterium]